MEKILKMWVGLSVTLTLVILGSNIPNKTEADTDGWQATSMLNAPDGRRNAVAVWTGNEMLVWGGENANGTLNTGARYDPVTDLWTPMSSVGAPTPRRLLAAVWTGTEMIVWGGETGNGQTTLNDGSRYNPLTDTWTPMTNVNAPAGRLFHTAVWTGIEMIVWGGDLESGDVQVTNTGGRYNPSSDTWITTTTVNAPSARNHHAAVWTGTEMIIWGGSPDCCLPTGGDNTGGRYDPIADSWMATSTVNTPDARVFFTSSWTGSHMIVWGGIELSTNGPEYVNTGYQFDPLSNIWTQIQTLDAPSARGYTQAIWTGNEVIIWGGYDGTSRLNSGGRYDPQANTWSPTTLEGAPICRNAHTAIWTGSEMIVWGGFDHINNISYFLNTGGIYNPTVSNPSPATPCDEVTPTPTQTNTPVPTVTITATDTPSPTSTSTWTPTPTDTATATATSTSTSTSTPSSTPTATQTPTPSPTSIPVLPVYVPLVMRE